MILNLGQGRRRRRPFRSSAARPRPCVCFASEVIGAQQCICLRELPDLQKRSILSVGRNPFALAKASGDR